MSDVTAAALAHLADDEITIIDYAADLRADLDSYQLITSVALGQIHDLTQTIRRQSATIERLHAVIRDYITAPSTRRDRRAA